MCEMILPFQKVRQQNTGMSLDLTLDDAKEFIYVAIRSQERFSANLQTLVQSLDKLKEGEDEWLLQVLEEAEKGQAFCATQLNLWGSFQERVEAFVASVRKQADEMAIQGEGGGSSDRRCSPMPSTDPPCGPMHGTVANSTPCLSTLISELQIDKKAAVRVKILLKGLSGGLDQHKDSQPQLP